MRLKQRVLTGNPQSGRLTAQSSPLQKRSLSNYPTEHTKTEIIEAIQQKWAFKRNVVEQVSSATEECENWKQYGRQQFNAALNDQNENMYRVTKRPQSVYAGIGRNACEWQCRIEHNGPTLRGSVLYGQRHAMPNFYQQRPYSEPPIKYDQSKTRKHLNRRNNGNYECRPVTVTTRTDMPILLSALELENEIALRNVTPGSNARLTMESNGSCEGNTDIRLEGRESSSTTFLRYQTGTSRFDVPLISLSEDALSEPSEESENENEVSDEIVKTYDPAKPVSSLLRSLKEKEPMSTPNTPVPDGAIFKKRSKHLKGPRCWVDDATVSSISSEKDIYEDQTGIKSDDVVNGHSLTPLPQGNPTTSGYLVWKITQSIKFQIG